MLYTCIGILAVDFNAFPRRLAKAENFGQGLMDVGVGAIVFAAGLVTKASRVEQRSAVPTASRLCRALRSQAPCLLMGLGRLASVKSCRYPVGWE